MMGRGFTRNGFSPSVGCGRQFPRQREPRDAPNRIEGIYTSDEWLNALVNENVDRATARMKVRLIRNWRYFEGEQRSLTRKAGERWALSDCVNTPESNLRHFAKTGRSMGVMPGENAIRFRMASCR